MSYPTPPRHIFGLFNIFSNIIVRCTLFRSSYIVYLTLNFLDYFLHVAPNSSWIPNHNIYYLIHVNRHDIQTTLYFHDNEHITCYLRHSCLPLLFPLMVCFGNIMTPNEIGDNRNNRYVDPRFKRLLWYLIGSTKGGANRARILDFIKSNPSNTNRIASELKVDYKTITHHLKVLSQNGLIITDNPQSYGATYFLTPIMEMNYEVFRKEILAKIGKK